LQHHTRRRPFASEFRHSQKILTPLKPRQASAHNWSLSRQALAPLGAPFGQHAPTGGRRHARTESVAALAHQNTRLIGPLHRLLSIAAPS
jgi:hypothetical protein